MNAGETTQAAEPATAQQAVREEAAELHCKLEELKERLSKLHLTEAELFDLYALEQQSREFAEWMTRLRFALKYHQDTEWLWSL